MVVDKVYEELVAVMKAGLIEERAKEVNCGLQKRLQS